uniref:Uncharacterized protein n=1 Tax=Crocodylus porosus TaxID=8502 RepID=A0A7M4G0N1_CROPO
GQPYSLEQTAQPSPGLQKVPKSVPPACMLLFPGDTECGWTGKGCNDSSLSCHRHFLIWLCRRHRATPLKMSHGTIGRGRKNYLGGLCTCAPCHNS